MVYSVFKPAGATPLEMLHALRELNPALAHEPLTYAGRLDPIAEGVLLVLSGEHLKDRERFLHLDKTYEVEALVGIATDSYDLLGMPKPSHKSYSLSDIQKFVTEFQGEVRLHVPPYSSVPFLGKPLFEWARSGEVMNFELPQRIMKMKTLKLKDVTKISSAAVLDAVVQKIQNVKGDFRQTAIIREWKNVLSTHRYEFELIKIFIECGSGTYVRSIVHELGKRLGAGACVFTLKRLSVGDYSVTTSIKI